MACRRVWNDDWKEDNSLEAGLKKYVNQNFKKKDILDLVNSEQYEQYAWSMRTLTQLFTRRSVKFMDSTFKDVLFMMS